MARTLLEGNRRFVTEHVAGEREFYASLLKGQRPAALWIGCSDSRVPANLVTQSRPGEIFVHRNVGNIVATNDWNLGAVLEYALDHLHVPDVVVCGHDGCGAMQALDAKESHDRYLPVWLANAREARERVDARIRSRRGHRSQEDRLRLIVEENVRLQLEHLRGHPVVAEALAARRVTLHGWVYDLASGRIRVLPTGRRR